jgi:hypothetical protein
VTCGRDSAGASPSATEEAVPGPLRMEVLLHLAPVVVSYFLSFALFSFWLQQISSKYLILAASETISVCRPDLLASPNISSPYTDCCDCDVSGTHTHFLCSFCFVLTSFVIALEYVAYLFMNTYCDFLINFFEIVLKCVV